MATQEAMQVVGLGILSIWADDLFWLVVGIVRHNFPVWSHRWLGSMGKREANADSHLNGDK